MVINRSLDLNSLLIYFLLFGFPLLLIGLVYVFLNKRNTRNAIAKLNDSYSSGMMEPSSLHPAIDPLKCLGCASCVSACPEGDILGLINRKAVLVSPSSCIGHGACRAACPTGAIELVFGTEKRGVEIPLLNTNFESSVDGIYIVGELGGMGLIRNAITQGQQAVTAIAKKRNKKSAMEYDLVIVGAGPAGLSATLAAKEKGLKFVTLEQDTVGGTIAHYPRGKVVMTQPAKLPLIGKFQFREASKEKLIEFWDQVLHKVDVSICTGERVDDIQSEPGGFTVVTNRKSLKTQTVLLAMGRRGTPRKLNVAGEDLSKVIYRLIDPEQYVGKKVLVVGGGDSALEAALAIAAQPQAQTWLSYRSDSFSRAKQKNRELIDAAVKSGKINLLLSSEVKLISEREVEIELSEKVIKIPNDYVLVCAGGVLPTPFLKKIGINVEEKFGER
jgi:thioredoxin reductase (NADPH)